MRIFPPCRLGPETEYQGFKFGEGMLLVALDDQMLVLSKKKAKSASVRSAGNRSAFAASGVGRGCNGGGAVVPVAGTQRARRPLSQWRVREGRDARGLT